MIRVEQRRFIRRNNIFCIFNMHTLHFSSKYPYLILFRLFNELQKKNSFKIADDIDNCQRLLLRFTVAAVVVVIVTITY